MNITFINRMMGIKFGGGENFDLNMARALKKRGHNIRFVIGIADDYEEPVKLDDDCEVIKVKTLYLRDIHYKIKPTNFFNKLISVGALEFDLLQFENRVLKILKNDNWTDVYQICGLPRLGAKLNDKNSTKYQLTAVRWPGPPSKRKLKWMKKCNINFANGDAYRIIQETLLPEIKEVNIGINTKKFYPVEKKRNKRVGFLFVGRIIPVKNLSFLINGFKEALKVSSNIVLHIVGDGDPKELEKIKNLSRNIPNIKFLGKVVGDDLVKIYQHNDVFCITSVYDNFPNVVFEAMACGLPVIGTNVGGIPMQIENEKTGILVKSNDIGELKSAILRLSLDEKLRNKMSRAGREKIEKEFSWDKSAEQLESIYMEYKKKCVD